MLYHVNKSLWLRIILLITSSSKAFKYSFLMATKCKSAFQTHVFPFDRLIGQAIISKVYNNIFRVNAIDDDTQCALRHGISPSNYLIPRISGHGRVRSTTLASALWRFGKPLWLQLISLFSATFSNRSNKSITERM